MTVRRTSAVLSGAALMGALLAAPTAHADRYEEADPAGDMAISKGGSAQPRPAHRNLDIRHVTVRHTDHFVSVRVVTSALTRPRNNEQFDLFGFIKVDRRAQPSESAAWTWEVEFDKQRPRQGDRMFILDAEHQEEFGCDGYTDSGLKARANYRRDRVTVVIPRRCLVLQEARPNIRPEWVRVSVTAVNSRANFRRQYFDHLRAPASVPMGGQFNSDYDRWLTPRLYAG
jgi:hypothetical protein